MDHELSTNEEYDFIKDKCLGVLNKVIGTNLKMNDIEFLFNRLDGISNKIYKVSVKSKNAQIVLDLFFKFFGKISSENFKLLKVYLYALI